MPRLFFWLPFHPPLKHLPCSCRSQSQYLPCINSFFVTKYVSPPYCRAEMYDGRIACCPMVSHKDYGMCALLRLEKRPDRQTEGSQTVTLRLLLDAVSIIKQHNCSVIFSLQATMLINMNLTTWPFALLQITHSQSRLYSVFCHCSSDATKASAM